MPGRGGVFLISAAVIRSGTPADAVRLPAIERSAGEAFRKVSGLEWVADDQIQDAAWHAARIAEGCCWLATPPEKDTPVGFLCGQSFGLDFHVAALAVSREAQGLGMGKRLMTQAHAHAVQTGHHRLTLTTFRDVAFNDGFYARLGFKIATPTQMGNRLRDILSDEASSGLPADRRIAMTRCLIC